LFPCWVITLPIHLTVINYKIFGRRGTTENPRELITQSLVTE